MTLGEMLDAMFAFMANADWAGYRTDPVAFQRELEAVFQPSGELSLAIAVASGLSLVVVDHRDRGHHGRDSSRRRAVGGRRSRVPIARSRRIPAR